MMRRVAHRVIGLGVGCLAFGMGLSRVSHGQSPDMVADSTAQVSAALAAMGDSGDIGARDRVREFLAELSDSLAQLIPAMHAPRQEPDPTLKRSPHAYLTSDSTAARGSFGSLIGGDLPGLSLDSLRQLWMNATPQARLTFVERGGLGEVTVLDTALVREGHVLEVSAHLAQAMLDGARRLAPRAAPTRDLSQLAALPESDREAALWYRSRLVQMRASANELLGVVRLAQHDTAAAVRAFLDVARAPLLASALPAARRAFDLTSRTGWGSDAHLMALTLSVLESRPGGGREEIGNAGIRGVLAMVYGDYVAAHGAAPDVIADIADPLPPSPTPLTLDAYLDRQFTVLYDRGFAVGRAPDLSETQRTGRLVILEYLTGINCHGCWNKDRGFGAIARRYPRDQVLVIGFPDGMTPDAISVDSLWMRMLVWYPMSAKKPAKQTFAYFRNFFDPVIPRQSLLTSRGDTIRIGEGHLDGVPLGPKPGDERWELEYGELKGGEPLLYALVARDSIDAARLRGPKARVRVRATWEGQRVVVTAQVDSVQGHHPRAALRLLLIEDTIHARVGTIRRVHCNLVRDFAHSLTLPVGLPIQLDRPATATYTFDVARQEAKLQAQLKEQVLAYAGTVSESDFFDFRDWHIDPAHLHVVAFVQDLDTGEILQAAQVTPARACDIHHRRSVGSAKPIMSG